MLLFNAGALAVALAERILVEVVADILKLGLRFHLLPLQKLPLLVLAVLVGLQSEMLAEPLRLERLVHMVAAVVMLPLELGGAVAAAHNSVPELVLPHLCRVDPDHLFT